MNRLILMNWLVPIFLTLISFQINGATKTEMKKLLNSLDRPPVEVLLPIFKQYDKNPFSDMGSFSRARRIASEFPSAIASFEKWFPGGTYYGLGRDAVFITDVLNMFYLSLNQEGRVKRLDASNPSFSGDDDEMTLDFLRSNDFNPMTQNTSVPYVIFDTTSFSHTHGVGGGASQSVRLIRAGYKGLSRHHKNVKTLIPKFNFISIGGYSNAPFYAMQPDFNVVEFFERQAQSITKRTGYIQFPLFFDLSHFTYGIEWHGIFERFQKGDDGRVFSPRGIDYSDRQKKEILSELYDSWRVVSDPNFLKMVENEAILRGFHFPLSHTSELNEASQNEVKAAIKAQNEIAETRKKMEEEERKKELALTRKNRNTFWNLSERGAELVDRFEDGLFQAGIEVYYDLDGGDRVSKALTILVRLIFEDIHSTTTITEADADALLRSFLAPIRSYHSTKYVHYLAKQIKKNHLFMMTLEKMAPPYTDLYRAELYLSDRVSQNISKLRTYLTPPDKKENSCAKELNPKQDDDDIDGWLF